MEKKLIPECVLKDISSVIFNTNLESLIDKLCGFRIQFPEYKNLYFVDDSYGYDLKFELYGDRYETDEECEKRIEKEKLKKMTPKQKKEIKEKEQLKKLIAKYGVPDE